MEEARYTKAEIKRAERFSRFRDAVEALLEEDCAYTVEEAEEIVRRFMEGRV